MNNRILAAALTTSLLFTGCGPSKKVEKGTDDKVVLGTNTENKTDPKRPPVIVPADAAAKTKATTPDNNRK